MDFGSGTGLLLAKIAPYVDEITAIDISKSMNEVLKNKKGSIDCKLEIIEIDLTREDLNKKFDGTLFQEDSEVGAEECGGIARDLPASSCESRE